MPPPAAISEREIVWRFVQSSGPGGQNVNKVASAAQLRFDVARSASLSEPVQARLIARAGRRVSGDGVLIITAQRFRSQERNRADALERLQALVAQASERPEHRVKTRVSHAQKQRRLEGKTKRATLKASRRPIKE